MSTEQIRNVLREFQKGYSLRDASCIDEFMEHLFVKDNDMLIIGTGLHEWSIGLEEAKELIEWDWKYWGDVVFDVDNAIISCNGNMGWIAVMGRREYEIDTEDIFSKVVSYSADDINSNMSAKSKLLFIQAEMTDVLASLWKGRRLKAVDPLRFTATVMKRDVTWRFAGMHFSFATIGFPDERILSNGVDRVPWNPLKTVDKVATALREHSGSSDDVSKKVRLQLREFERALNEKKSSNDLSRFFTKNNEAVFIGSGAKELYKGRGQIQQRLRSLYETPYSVELAADDSFILQGTNAIWVSTYGNVITKLPAESIYETQINAVKESLGSGTLPKDKLLSIIAQIGQTMRETNCGTEYVWPLRFEAIAVREEGQWLIQQLHLSHPTTWPADDRTIEVIE